MIMSALVRATETTNALNRPQWPSPKAIGLRGSVGVAEVWVVPMRNAALAIMLDREWFRSIPTPRRWRKTQAVRAQSKVTLLMSAVIVIYG